MNSKEAMVAAKMNDDEEKVYQENIDFWEKAWAMVKTPYKQLPNMSYVSRIPQELNSRQVKTVLDLGCGSGWLSVYLAREGFTVTGVDVSSQAINLGKMWSDEENLNIDFVVEDLAHLTFADKQFDAVVANSIFEHFPLDKALLIAQKVFSMLKAGGTFIGCFDNVGGGPGEYYTLADGTHVYTDKGRKGMLLRKFSDAELATLCEQFATVTTDEVDSGSKFLIATKA